MTTSPALTVVMPVYNEAAAIGGVVRAWAAELERLGIDYEMRVYDDGSRDTSATVLEELSNEVPRLLVTRHSNRGHGPTILRGYREARGEWVFQTDSDGEMEPDSFRLLWEKRADYDFLLGIRGGRVWTPPRWVMTRGSRLAVRILFGAGVADVNTPYRLMRRDRLVELMTSLPDDLFAPNMILAGLALRRGLRLYQIEVPHQGRRTAVASLAGVRKLVKPAARSLRQTIAIARRAKHAPPAGKERRA